MKKILLILLIACSFYTNAQVQNGGVIRAQANDLSIGQIKRTGDALKVADSSVLGKLNATIAVTKSGTWDITNAGTFATQSVLTTGSAQIGHLEANQSTNVAQINGVTPLMGNGVTGTGSLRVTIASDNTAFPVNATLQTGSAQIGHLEANQSVNVAQINGVTTLMGNGVTGTGSQRVTIASDNTAFSVNPLSATAPIVSMNSASANSGINSAMAGVFDDAAITSITENNFGFLRMSANRNLYGTIRDAAGNERGVNVNASNQMSVSVDNTPNIGTVTTVTTVSTVTNLSQMNGAALLMGNGVTGTGSQRVTIASDNTAFSVNPLSATTPVSTMNSASANSGLNSAMALVFDDVSPTAITENNFGFARMSANRNQYMTIRDAAGNERGVNVTASNEMLVNVNNSVTVTATNLSTNVAQINGVTPLMGNGVTGTGSPRVTLASDGTAISTTGYMSVKLDQTTIGTTNGVTDVPATSGGYTTFHLVSAGSTNATSVKGSAGQLYGYYIFNANAAARKVAFHNTSGTPTAGASIFFSLVIPASSAANVSFPAGVPFSSGIGITTVTGTADSDATGVASGDLIINLFYK